MTSATMTLTQTRVTTKRTSNRTNRRLPGVELGRVRVIESAEERGKWQFTDAAILAARQKSRTKRWAYLRVIAPEHGLTPARAPEVYIDPDRCCASGQDRKSVV